MKLILPLLVLFTIAGGRPLQASDFTLWQLPSQTHSQIMSYVIRTEHGKLIVIDGGVRGDAEYLAKFIGERGGKVEAWFITHPHSDHIEAITEILSNHKNIETGRIYASLPSEDWISRHEKDALKSLTDFNSALLAANRCSINLVLGAMFQIDGIRINVLGIKNPELTANALNNSCVVLRISDSSKSVIFLADLGPEAGDKLLNSRYASQLPADYVQMAHHGQNGVNKNVYELINAKACLWPTPVWLWNNDTGTGTGSGPWKTLEVRQWMDDLGVKQHHVMKDGLCLID